MEVPQSSDSEPESGDEHLNLVLRMRFDNYLSYTINSNIFYNKQSSNINFLFQVK